MHNYMHMPFITFIYKIGKRAFYGKYVSTYVSDDHNGLDVVIHPILLEGVNIFRKQKGLSSIKTIKIGILSFSVDSYAPCYSSEEEFKCFDFYYEEEDRKRTMYMNGQKIV
jgi:hypothetical protein